MATFRNVPRFCRLTLRPAQILARPTNGRALLMTKSSSLPMEQVTVISSKKIHTTMNARGAGSVINIQDEEDFKKRVMQSNLPVVVDFHANWCGPCKLLGPRLETLIGSHNSETQKIMLAKVDIDEMPDLAMNYGVEAVPTVISVKGGKVLDKFVGLKEDDHIETFLTKLVE